MVMRMDKALSRQYISVSYGRFLSFGGNQRRAQKSITRRCGCGVIACTDLSLYVAGRRQPIPSDEYNTLAETMRRKYLPLLPRFGTNGWMLAWGMNRYFKKHGIRLRAGWGVRKGRLRRAMGEMLSRDIPVILSIGQNFPFIWRKNRLNLYRLTDSGYAAVSSTKAHYVTITGMDDSWLHISSWGQKYYINWDEYVEYVERHSSWIISNILYIGAR